MRRWGGLGALLLAIACKGDPGPGVTTTGGSAAPGSGSGSAPASPPSLLAGVTLPASTGTPPKPTTQPLDATAFARLGVLTVPGFIARVRSVEHQLDVEHATERWTVSVMVAPCFDCVPMELAAWKTKEAGLRLLIPADLRDRADTVWELGQSELHGQRVIFTYQLGHAATTNATGAAEGIASHTYALYYGDGTNQIRVVAAYRADGITRAELAAVPRDDLARLATAFLDLYTHAW
ncbi:MAG: hypothetical protein JWP01_659 [Myxococcales bacterium]|nr:hypothetical protein [Myxococcales bacterium]